MKIAVSDPQNGGGQEGSSPVPLIVQGVPASNSNLNSPTQNFFGQEFFCPFRNRREERTPFQRRLTLLPDVAALDDALRSSRIIGLAAYGKLLL